MIDAILSRYIDAITGGMRTALDRPGLAHLRLMRYHLGWEDADGHAVLQPRTGKMLRPALCLLACEAVAGDVAQPPSAVERALPAAVAVELVHNFTLIHDDVEDASDTRHGRATLWRVAGVALAINAGDGMFVLAREHLLRLGETGVPSERVLAAIAILDEACIWLCEGQHADLSFESRAAVSVEEYEAMIAGKTAGLLGASMALGALVAGADARTVDAFGECGRWLGMAFQVQDDVLGVWGDPTRTGKPVADDIRAKKKSFPVVWALEHGDTRATDIITHGYAADTPDEVPVGSVVGALESSGAREASTETAEGWATRALDALRPLELDDERRHEIEAIANFFVRRDA